MATATEAPATSTTAEGPTPHTQIQPDLTPTQLAALAELRTPFPTEAIQYRPSIKCRACDNNPSGDCNEHVRIYCEACLRWVSECHVDLAYIGHADTTDRLLNADPMWSWEPLAFDERGLPQFDGFGGLWIRLTVCGMTRLGYGDSGDRKGPNALKEAIGDALRNAGMRFGMALDLWRTPPLDNRTLATGALRPEVRLKQLKEWAQARWEQHDRLRQILVWAEQEHFGEALVDFGGIDVPFGPLLRQRLEELAERHNPTADHSPDPEGSTA
ncbi:hypothetical protein [Streptomyces sp. NPDC001205]